VETLRVSSRLDQPPSPVRTDLAVERYVPVAIRRRKLILRSVLASVICAAGVGSVDPIAAIAQRGAAKLNTSVIVVPLDPIPDKTEEVAVVRFTSVSDGATFDIDADGVLDLVAWPTKSSRLAFLAVDINRNGKIDDGRELLGAQTLPGASDGFTALATLDPAVRSGSIAASDPLYERLLLWTDANVNGRCDEGELRPVREVLAKIGLGYFAVDQKDKESNAIHNRGWSIAVQDFTGRADDRIRPLFEVSPLIRLAPKRQQ